MARASLNENYFDTYRAYQAYQAYQVNNAVYYKRRAERRCPDCDKRVVVGVYCLWCRRLRRERVTIERHRDRDGYNLYMRVYKQQRKKRKA